jgi:2-polyprenyl-6-hydroxyphenyl methylase/3-demethylubiquinone-9 3-methyltransferase
VTVAARIGSWAPRLLRIVHYRPEQWAVSEWDRAYSSGQLAYFGDMDELARYSILTGYVRHLGGQPTIVDIGCGGGLLRRHLQGLPFASYLGIDISDVAVRQAMTLADDRTTFVCDDVITSDIPAADVIVLNEVLYFVEDPGALLGRIATVLHPGGRLMVSMWRHSGDHLLWAQLGRRFPLEDQVDVRNPASSLSRRGWRVASYYSATSRETR